MKIRRSAEDWILDTIIYSILIIILVFTLYPFYYTLVVSLNSGLDTNMGGIYLWPRKFTLANYMYFLKNSQWTDAFLITVLRTVVGTFLSVLFTSMVAYGLSKKDLKFRSFYFVIIIFAMNFSGGLIAFYVVLRSLGLLDTFGVYVIPTMLNLFFLLISVSFYQEIPSELGESARMDGAGELKIFLRLILPLSLPLVATMSLFIGSGQWNSWLDSAYFVQSQHLRTLAYQMIQVINQSMIPATSNAVTNLQRSTVAVTSFSVQTAAMIISIAPIVCVYPFIQKYFVKGIMLGSVKG